MFFMYLLCAKHGLSVYTLYDKVEECIISLLWKQKKKTKKNPVK